VARPGRLELPTLCLEGRRSIQLSYGRTVKAKLILEHFCAITKKIPVNAITSVGDASRNYLRTDEKTRELTCGVPRARLMWKRRSDLIFCALDSGGYEFRNCVATWSPVNLRLR
jgi:hypothetical protein